MKSGSGVQGALLATAMQIGLAAVLSATQQDAPARQSLVVVLDELRQTTGNLLELAEVATGTEKEIAVDAATVAGDSVEFISLVSDLVELCQGMETARDRRMACAVLEKRLRGGAPIFEVRIRAVN